MSNFSDTVIRNTFIFGKYKEPSDGINVAHHYMTFRGNLSIAEIDHGVFNVGDVVMVDDSCHYGQLANGMLVNNGQLLCYVDNKFVTVTT